MLGQVVVGAVRHTPKLAPAEGEHELKVGGGLGVEAQLFRIMVPETQVLVLHVQIQQPLVAEVSPVLKPLQIGAGLAEELQLHLLELTGAEGEVARRDLIAEGLADLADAEGQLPAGGTLDVVEVDKNALGRFRTQIDGIFRILRNALDRKSTRLNSSHLKLSRMPSSA